MSSSTIGIFIATMTGTAELCAEEVESALSKAGADFDRLLMDGLAVSALAPYDIIVIVSSTYGQGDIPDNGQGLFEDIEANGDLAGKHFTVFGLGDMTYAATFCEAGSKWDSLLELKGAKRFAPLYRHDAADGTLAEDTAHDWAESWVANLPELQAAS